MNSIETKVIAAMGGSGLGAALSAFALWLLGVIAFGASSNADQVAKAVAAVPEPVGALLSILVAIFGAFIGGYAAPHTSRPDLAHAPMLVTPPTQPRTIPEPPATNLVDAAPTGTLPVPPFPAAPPAA